MRGAVILLAAAALAACTRAPRAACPDGARYDSLVLAHLARYPAMDVTDALKLLQQATLGSEHAVTDSAAAAAWMAREWAALGDGPAEPLVDTLGAGSRFARVHLRPWRAAGGSPDALTGAFVRTAREPGADTVRLGCAMDALSAMARRGAVPWPPDTVRIRAAAWAAERFPAMHHSAVFAQHYRPAYRVVALPLVPGLPN